MVRYKTTKTNCSLNKKNKKEKKKLLKSKKNLCITAQKHNIKNKINKKKNFFFFLKREKKKQQPVDNLYLCINNMVRCGKAFYFLLTNSLWHRSCKHAGAACDQQGATSSLNGCLPVKSAQDALSYSHCGVLRLKVATLISNKQNYQN